MICNKKCQGFDILALLVKIAVGALLGMLTSRECVTDAPAFAIAGLACGGGPPTRSWTSS